MNKQFLTLIAMALTLGCLTGPALTTTTSTSTTTTTLAPLNTSELIRQAVVNADGVSLVLDLDASPSAMQSYIELVGVFSFIQSVVADDDADGKISPAESGNNTFIIYPYIRRDGLCTMQPPYNVFGETLEAGEDVECSTLHNVVFLEGTGEGNVSVEGSVITISGGEDSIYENTRFVIYTLVPNWAEITGQLPENESTS